jgi:hypothetical protein
MVLADFFSPSLLVSRACPMVLPVYVQDHLPEPFAHLSNTGINLPAICFSWSLSLEGGCSPLRVELKSLTNSIAFRRCLGSGTCSCVRIMAWMFYSVYHWQSSRSVKRTYYVVNHSLLSIPYWRVYRRCGNADKLLKVGQVLLVIYVADAFVQVEAEVRPILLHDDIVKRI